MPPDLDPADDSAEVQAEQAQRHQREHLRARSSVNPNTGYRLAFPRCAALAGGG
jgi:hypothetical protein